MALFRPGVRMLLVVDRDADPVRLTTAARMLLGDDVDWTILVPVPRHPELTVGATGFAGPVLSPAERDEIARADRVAADAAASEAAGALGPRPIRQLVERGTPSAVVSQAVSDEPFDAIVVNSTDLAEDLTSDGLAPIMVVSERQTQRGHGPVLIAVDDTPLDDRVIDVADRLFDLEHTEYALLHVADAKPHVQPLPFAHFAGVPATGDVLRRMQRERRAARDVAESTAAEHDMSGATAMGEVADPVNGILDTADEHDAAAILIGTHDRGWLSHLLRPSVSRAVTDRSVRPIVVAASAAADAP